MAIAFNYEMGEFRMKRGGSTTKVALDFWIADFNLLRDLLGRILWDMALERRGVQEGWVILKITSSELKKGPS